jgi:tetratricopeptide (TPR) repeat protein
MGRLNEAIVEIKQASELDPLSLEINTDLGLSFLFARQYDRALEQFEKVVEMDPNFIWTHFFMGWAYEQKNDYEKAIREFQRAAQLDDSPLILAALGQRVEALAFLEKSFGAREEALVWLKVDPRLDTLRTDPRFIDLQRRVGLPL